MNNKALTIVLIVSVVLNVACAMTLVLHWIKVSEVRQRFPVPRELRFMNEFARQRDYLIDLLSRKELDSIAISECIDRLIELRARREADRLKRMVHRLGKLPHHRREKVLEMMRHREGDYEEEFNGKSKMEGRSKKSRVERKGGRR